MPTEVQEETFTLEQLLAGFKGSAPPYIMER